MKKIEILLILILSFGFLNGKSQNTGNKKKIKSVTGYNIERKTRELDHVTIYNQDGLKTEESEYFSDGIIKTKTVFEYDSKKS